MYSNYNIISINFKETLKLADPFYFYQFSKIMKNLYAVFSFSNMKNRNIIMLCIKITLLKELYANFF